MATETATFLLRFQACFVTSREWRRCLSQDGNQGRRLVGLTLSPRGCLRAGGTECELSGSECELAGSTPSTGCELPTCVVCEPAYGLCRAATRNSILKGGVSTACAP